MIALVQGSLKRPLSKPHEAQGNRRPFRKALHLPIIFQHNGCPHATREGYLEPGRQRGHLGVSGTKTTIDSPRRNNFSMQFPNFQLRETEALHRSKYSKSFRGNASVSAAGQPAAQFIPGAGATAVAHTRRVPCPHFSLTCGVRIAEDLLEIEGKRGRCGGNKKIPNPRLSFSTHDASSIALSLNFVLCFRFFSSLLCFLSFQ